MGPSSHLSGVVRACLAISAEVEVLSGARQNPDLARQAWVGVVGLDEVQREVIIDVTFKTPCKVEGKWTWAKPFRFSGKE